MSRLRLPLPVSDTVDSIYAQSVNDKIEAWANGQFFTLSDTPPKEPFLGQFWVYKTLQWLFYYGAGTNPWRFIGGPPFAVTSNTPQSTTGGGGALLFTDVAITVPRTGQYLVSFFTDAEATPNAGTATVQWFMQAWDNTSSTAVTNFITMASFYAHIAQDYHWTAALSNQSAALTVGHSIILKANPAPQNWDFISNVRGLSIIPVAVT